MAASTENTATESTRPVPTRKASIDPQAAEALEKKLAQRPEKRDLVDRNILKGTSTDTYEVHHRRMVYRVIAR